MNLPFRDDSLSEEERRTYEKAQGVVQQAKAKTEKSADSAAFRKLDAVYKERKEIWEDR